MMNRQELYELAKDQIGAMYVYDLGVLKERVEFLRAHLPKEVELCYAIKANSFVLKQLSEWVDYLEICSPGELAICRELGIDARKYVVSGVYKDSKMVETALAGEHIPAYFTVESMAQFHLLMENAKKHECKIKLLLRLTSGNQFGLDEEELMYLVRDCRDEELAEICGVQYFTGTQKTSLKKIRRELEYVDGVLLRLKEEIGYRPDKLEYGTGFPVSYFEGDSFDEEEFLSGFGELLSGLQFDGKITLEIVRSIVASCGTYLTHVVDTKCCKGENYAIVDGGIHQLVYYGQFMAMKHPKMCILPERTKDAKKTWNICGALCTINDILVKQMEFDDLKAGDVLAFFHAGAYCASEGIAMFLSRDLPKIVLVDQGKVQIVRDTVETYAWNMPGLQNK